MEASEYWNLYLRERQHWFAVGRRSLVAQCVSYICETRPAKILEIGSGTGGNVEVLSTFGQLTCIEKDTLGCFLTRQAHGNHLDLRQGSWPSPSLLSETENFDLALFLDVLEHLGDPLEALERTVQHVKPRGHVVITVPAYQWMWSTHDETLHHFRRYTAPELTDLAVKAGLRPTYWTYFNSLLFPLAVIARQAATVLGVRASPGQKVPTTWINSLLKTIFMLERHWVGKVRAPFGLSILLIAEVPE